MWSKGEEPHMRQVESWAHRKLLVNYSTNFQNVNTPWSGLIRYIRHIPTEAESRLSRALQLSVLP